MPVGKLHGVIVFFFLSLVPGLWCQNNMDVVSRFPCPWGDIICYWNNAGHSGGDLNGDGQNDVVVLCMQDSTWETAFCIFHEVPDSALTVPYQIIRAPYGSENPSFGTSWDYSGDLNGDGCNDLVVSMDGEEDWGGEVLIYWGGETLSENPDVWIYANDVYDGDCWTLHFGSNLLCGGDYNGDGYDDLVVYASGSPYNSTQVFLFYGGNSFDIVCDFHLEGNEVNYGAILYYADLNGDGYDELVVLVAKYSDSGTFHFVDIFEGGQSIATSPIEIIPPDHWGAELSGGDVNHDGYGDVLGVSAVLYGNPNLSAITFSTFEHDDSGWWMFAYCHIPDEPYPAIACIKRTMVYTGHYSYALQIFCQDDTGLDLLTPDYTCGIINENQSFYPDRCLGDISGDGNPEFIGEIYNTESGAVVTQALIVSTHYVTSDDHTTPHDKTALVCFPNPAREGISIRLSRSNPNLHGSVEIFNVRGQRVRELSLSPQGDAYWDARDQQGHRVAAGVYFCRVINTKTWMATQKILIVK